MKKPNKTFLKKRWNKKFVSKFLLHHLCQQSPEKFFLPNIWWVQQLEGANLLRIGTHPPLRAFFLSRDEKRKDIFLQKSCLLEKKYVSWGLESLAPEFRARDTSKSDLNSNSRVQLLIEKLKRKTEAANRRKKFSNYAKFTLKWLSV